MGRSFVASLDMYRKVPVDLLEGTRRGSILSTVAVFTMALLFFLETKAFFAVSLKTNLALDGNTDSQIRVNFNITMMDLKCEFATIDVVSVLGTQQNVTQHVQKFPIDQDGVRQRYQSRNLKQHDVQLFDALIEDTIEELHADGEDAVSLDATTLEVALKENTYVFVDFFANWCSHCRDLMPTWETLAEVMFEVAENKVEEQLDRHPNKEHEYSDEEYQAAVVVELPVLIGKVDCVDHHDLCLSQGIRAYPTLKFFVDGEAKGDYRGHRTVVELAHFIEQMEKEHKGKGEDSDVKSSEAKDVAADRTIQNDEHAAYAGALSAGRHKIQHAWADADHPGCQLSGFLLVDRAPGNFHIQAQSKNHDLAAHMTNVSHIINHLSFGKPFSKYFIKEGLKNTPPGFLESTRPFDGNVYATRNEHEAHHHYLKVITTEFDAEKMARKKYDKSKGFYRPPEPNRAYQILQSSQLSLYRTDIVPEAKFTYDLSPIAVSYVKKYRAWYDYFTSVMAIVGGTFTVVGMMESGIHSVSSKKRR
mmetsp:Transcript_12503/g.26925  ORF Transcript_12503/g.26925 Transcript_12503/m.26925 type:complete len:532 (+) Transcript_12503:128-1723(+)|eukprot:CAMPEP_0172551202 /NCGR_PEP_ID=MMETSP1067-20121228/36678_1 /TAXON_ID=265564 ORGANISM="Thalassiosira punctigera, Strain Tpunct2005C2" /NCGR_SAMPLE_ID=MMETSP1067 /ASSEMBLY_ACC=CAM_ASM_000444 /LENGTH=531 /DNA_ID=CAMNT_0013338955 /DNA_START=111 /DNA_END=1706 /DNA_ORIENTATION=+